MHQQLLLASFRAHELSPQPLCHNLLTIIQGLKMSRRARCSIQVAVCCTIELPEESKLLIWPLAVNRRLDQLFCNADLLNENLKKTEYAVRGELYMRAEELRKAGKEIIFTNGALAPPPASAFRAALESGSPGTCELQP